MELSGGCLCGAIRYRFEGEPLSAFHCNCRDCQRAGGSAFHHGILVREAQLSVTGEVRDYTSKSDAGRAITREFCPICGSGLFNRLVDLAPGTVVLRGGTLDDPSAVPPNYELFARSRVPWVRLDEHVRSFEGPADAPPKELRWRPRS